MSKVSIIVPSRNERYLSKTISDIYSKAAGEFEVVVVLDGKTEYPISASYPNLVIIDKSSPVGIRASTNYGVLASSGEYILKVDAHCMFGEGFDEILQQDCEDDWIVVARRYTLNLEEWSRNPRIVDYYYLSCPWTHPKSFMMQSCPWITRTGERENILIDDLMAFQGSLWFMSRKHWEHLGGLELGEETYAEHHELSMKTWLGGGRVVINKNAWYAHPRTLDKGYHMSLTTTYQDHAHSAHYWTENKWEGRIHDFDWLIDKFWPLPTERNRHRTEKYYWPENWRKYYE